MTVTTGHLCSGYDGLGLALGLVEPHDTLWHAEIDPAASAVLEREHPDVPNVGDFVDVLLADLWRLAPFVDMVTAGFPCQPVSAAGRQLAQLDPRWLWPFVIEVVRQSRPFRVFIENVMNLVSIQGGAVWRGILDDLRAAGYASRWVVMGACAVGAPHHRHRVFLVADLVGDHAPEAIRVEPKVVCGAPRSGGRLLLPTPLVRDAARTNEGSAEYWAARGVKHAPPLGAVVGLLPTPRTSDTNGAGTHGDGGLDLRTAVNMLPTPTVANAQGNRFNGETPPRVLLPGAAADPARWGAYADAVALWERITGTAAPEPSEPSPKGSRRMSALLPEWMMGLRPGYVTTDVSRSDAIKLAGNGVVPLQAATAYRLLTS